MTWGIEIAFRDALGIHNSYHSWVGIIPSLPLLLKGLRHSCSKDLSELKHWTCNVIEKTTLQFSYLYPLSISKDAERRLLVWVWCQLCPFPVKEKESKRSTYLLSGKYFFSKDCFFTFRNGYYLVPPNHI